MWAEDLEKELRILLVEVLFFLFVFFGGFEGLQKKMQAVRMQPNAVVSTAQKYGGSCCCSSRETYCSIYMPRSSFTSTEVPFFIFLLSCCCLTYCLCFTRFFCVGNLWESACKVPWWVLHQVKHWRTSNLSNHGIKALAYWLQISSLLLSGTHCDTSQLKHSKPGVLVEGWEIQLLDEIPSNWSGGIDMCSESPLKSTILFLIGVSFRFLV